MTKYFVYAVTGDVERERTYAFVADDNAAKFASEEFKPATMTYTGVMVEADSPIEANEAYNRPTEDGGNFMMADEPKGTAIKRQVYEAKTHLLAGVLPELKKQLQALIQETSRASAKSLSVRIAHQLTDLNVSLSELARLIRKASSDNEALDDEGVYERIKENYLKRFFTEFKYTTDRPNTDG